MEGGVNIEPFFEPRYLNIEYFFYKIYTFFSGIGNFFSGLEDRVYSFGSRVRDFTDYFFGVSFNFLSIFLHVLAIIFLIGIIYALVRIYEIRKAEQEKYGAVVITESKETRRNERWELVLAHLRSNNPSDWRLAIIEADNMLDDMVKKMGYEGEDLGERLKAVERSDFQTIESAWEAHKVRNQIVHQGAGFKLSHDEAGRVIKLYEKVFKEFSYI